MSQQLAHGRSDLGRGPPAADVARLAVLPPVETNGWTEKNTSQKAEDVRQMFIDTLKDWPDAHD